MLDFLAAFHDEELLSGRPPEGAWIVPETEALAGLHRVNLPIVRRALAALPESVDWRGFRGDSASYEEELLQYLWRTGVWFTISADVSPELRDVCLQLDVHWESFEQRPTEIVAVAEVEFTPGEWPADAPPMRYVAMRFTAIQGRLFKDGTEVKHLAVVSDRDDLSTLI